MAVSGQLRVSGRRDRSELCTSGRRSARRCRRFSRRRVCRAAEAAMRSMTAGRNPFSGNGVSREESAQTLETAPGRWPTSIPKPTCLDLRLATASRTPTLAAYTAPINSESQDQIGAAAGEPTPRRNAAGAWLCGKSLEMRGFLVFSVAGRGKSWPLPGPSGPLQMETEKNRSLIRV